MSDFTRLQQINAMLTAYRMRWVAYDAAHAYELQQERAAILAKSSQPAKDEQQRVSA